MLDVGPVLHEEGVCLVDDHDFNGRQEVEVVLVVGAINTDGKAQPERRCHNDV